MERTSFARGRNDIGRSSTTFGYAHRFVWKVHATPDWEGMKRLGIEATTAIGALLVEGGFEVWDRCDGVVPDGARNSPATTTIIWPTKAMTEKTRHIGPILGVEDGEILSGWLLKHASEPAAVAMKIVKRPIPPLVRLNSWNRQKTSWCLHLSYIKPHWPYIVPAPYHDMYGPEDIIPVNRSHLERQDPHPLMAAYYDYRYGRAFSRDDVREAVIPAYMGLITQIDDQIGRLMSYLKKAAR